MYLKDTPPFTPNNSDEAIMEAEDELYEEDVIEVIDFDPSNAHEDSSDDEGNCTRVEEGIRNVIDEKAVIEISDSDDDDASPINVNAYSRDAEGNKPTRDDASCIFQQHKGSVFCCHLEPKVGNLAVTGAEDDMAFVWKTNSGEIILNCTGHKDSVTCVQFSHDGTYVATGDMSGVVKVWKISSKSQVWETSVGDLTWLKWHHGANVLLGGTISGEVYMWRIPVGDWKLLPGHGSKTDYGLILPDGKRAAVGYEDGSIKIFDMKAATVVHHIPQDQAHTGPITDMDCHSDNNLLISGGVDGHAVVLKTQTGKIASVLDCNDSNQGAESGSNTSSVEAVGFCKEGSLSLAATGNLDGVLCIWDISKGVLRHKVKQDAGITKLLWIKNSPLLYTAGFDGSIRLYDGRNGELQNQLLGHSNCILDMSLSTDCRTLLSSSDDKTARVFSLQLPDE